jgi:hypothetical protein
MRCSGFGRGFDLDFDFDFEILATDTEGVNQNDYLTRGRNT